MNEESTIWSYDEEKEMEGDLTDEEGDEEGEEEEDDAEEAAPDFMEGDEMDDDGNEEREDDEENEDKDEENEASESRPPKRARVGGSEHLQRAVGGDGNDNDAEDRGSKDPQERVRKEWEDGPEAVAESGLSALALAFGTTCAFVLEFFFSSANRVCRVCVCVVCACACACVRVCRGAALCGMNREQDNCADLHEVGGAVYSLRGLEVSLCGAHVPVRHH